MKKALVLGGTGFIGSELSTKLSKEKYQIHILTQGFTKNLFGQIDGVSVIDYTKDNFLKILEDDNYDSIFILNSNPHPRNSYNNPIVDIDLQLTPLINLLDSLRIVNYTGKIWFASSVAVYGSNTGLLNEEIQPKPISPYGISKLSCENYCKYYYSEYGLNIGILRIFSTYGPNLKRQVIFDLYNKIKKNENKIQLLSLKNDSRDLSYVEDIANCIFFLNKSIVPKGDVFNIGSGNEFLIYDVAKLIASILNYKGLIEFSKSNLSYDGKSWYADIDKIKSLGFKSNYDLISGLKKTINEWEK